MVHFHVIYNQNLYTDLERPRTCYITSPFQLPRGSVPTVQRSV